MVGRVYILYEALGAYTSGMARSGSPDCVRTNYTTTLAIPLLARYFVLRATPRDCKLNGTVDACGEAAFVRCL